MIDKDTMAVGARLKSNVISYQNTANAHLHNHTKFGLPLSGRLILDVLRINSKPCNVAKPVLFH